jgi:argininosuccinate synthase
VRDNSWVRDEQLAYLEQHDMPLPAQGSAYSINRGLWGITIGGQETLTSQNSIPESAWVLSANAFSEPKDPSTHVLRFSKGVPAALDGKAMPPVRLIEALEDLAGSYGIGRGIHLGDTVLGTKGRVAFEAPAAITLITAHRELEKLVLSAQQMRIKDSVAAIYGDLVHEGKQLDLACDDVEALLASSQRRVSGRASCLSMASSPTTHFWRRRRVCTEKRPANGQPLMRSAMRASCHCRGHYRPGPAATHHEKRRRRQDRIGGTAQ